jgi:hypothetical protein
MKGQIGCRFIRRYILLRRGSMWAHRDRVRHPMEDLGPGHRHPEGKGEARHSLNVAAGGRRDFDP